MLAHRRRPKPVACNLKPGSAERGDLRSRQRGGNGSRRRPVAHLATALQIAW